MKAEQIPGKNQARENKQAAAHASGKNTVQLSDNRNKDVQQEKQPVEKQETIQKKENKTGLPDNLKTGVENLSGHSMGDVKVHYNSAQPAQLNAHAYAQGNQIHVAPGQEKHLPHEAWHVVQQKQGRVKPTKQLKRKTNINDDAGLENEADVMGTKAVSNDSTVQKKDIINTVNNSPTIQRRVQVGGFTISTLQNQDDLATYIMGKQKYDQGEENKKAGRKKVEAKKIAPLKSLDLVDLMKPLMVYYQKYSPPCKFQDILDLLVDWANAKSPSEVVPDEEGVIPLVSTQDNQFATVKDLFFALVQNIRSRKNIKLSEDAAMEILANFDYYQGSLLHMLLLIESEMQNMPKLKRKAIITAGYSQKLINPEKIDQYIYSTVYHEKNALLKLFIGVNTIHSFIIATNRIAKSHRKKMSSEMGDRTNKYSPFGPEIESARRRGLAVWSGFSGSTADILYLAQMYELSPKSIHKLAALTAAFFQFLPTSVNPTHTFHEVMLVADKLFGVPYNAGNPQELLPHKTGISGQRQEVIPRIGTAGPNVMEQPTDQLIPLHDVPRKGVPMTNITDIVSAVKGKGYNLSAPISATKLPNKDMLVTGGHHRIEAMKRLGQETAPVKLYDSKNTEKVKLAKMIGIARITGKYFHEWNPELTPKELMEVNAYLTEWKKHNDDQVKFDFLYRGKLMSKL